MFVKAFRGCAWNNHGLPVRTLYAVAKYERIVYEREQVFQDGARTMQEGTVPTELTGISYESFILNKSNKVNFICIFL